MQIPSLLPLTAGGRPLLSVASPEGQQRTLQAFLLKAAADAMPPSRPVCDLDITRPLVAYFNAMLGAVQHGTRPQHAALAEVLIAYLLGEYGVLSELPVAMQWQLGALRRLSEQGNTHTVRRQLTEVAAAAAAGQHPPAAPLPSFEQLHYLSHAGLLRTGSDLIKGEAQLPGSSSAVPVPQMVASSEALLALQPDNPYSWLSAGSAAAQQRRFVLAVERLIRGAELARQQRADVDFVSCAGTANVAAAESAGSIPASLAARATALVAEMEPAIKRANRLLPVPWVQPIQMMWQQLTAAGGRQRASSSLLGMMEVAQQVPKASDCAGCGRCSVGLRRCSRCHMVAYCRCVPLLLCPTTGCSGCPCGPAASKLLPSLAGCPLTSRPTPAPCLLQP